jgi:lipopolysaccharide biosynthesis regulator YciM
MSIYTIEILSGIFELGRMYYETGFFAPAERIFSGLIAVDNGATPSKLALGLVKLDLGLYNEASTLFRQCIEERSFDRSAKIALAGCFIAQNELKRAQSLLVEVAEVSRKNLSYEERKLLDGLLIRTKDL